MGGHRSSQLLRFSLIAQGQEVSSLRSACMPCQAYSCDRSQQGQAPAESLVTNELCEAGADEDRAQHGDEAKRLPCLQL
tara:strand:+ start:6665 stop:6901 length:237 start_codon:yes stop_codon:yes gene_type:complete